MTELHELGVAAAADAIRSGEISAERLVEALLERNTAFTRLNAFVSIDAEKVREAARNVDLARRRSEPMGVLAGVPLGIKDNIDVAGQETRAGTPALAGHRPRRDAKVAQTLRQAGAVFFGRTGMHELALGITNNNNFSGAVRNPYDERMIPGGSSGGAGASAAARLVPGGIGTDTGGSVRIPAALCGITALRPTTGRWPGTGIVPIATTRDTPGPMARNMVDLALLDAVVTGETAPAEPKSLVGIRLGIPHAHFWTDLDRAIEPVLSQALAALRDAGVILVEADIPDLAELNERASNAVAFHEPRRDMEAYLGHSGASVTFGDIVAQAASPDVKAIVETIADPRIGVSAETYREAIDIHRPRLVNAYREHFASHSLDALIFPTTPLAARPIGEDVDVELNGRRVPTFATFIRNTDPGSAAGLPGISLPAGLTAQGLPVGLALDGLPGTDRRLLSLGASIEILFPPLPGPELAALASSS